VRDDGKRRALTVRAGDLPTPVRGGANALPDVGRDVAPAHRVERPPRVNQCRPNGQGRANAELGDWQRNFTKQWRHLDRAPGAEPARRADRAREIARCHDIAAAQLRKQFRGRHSFRRDIRGIVVGSPPLDAGAIQQP
jgi:hypothetical protein